MLIGIIRIDQKELIQINIDLYRLVQIGQGLVLNYEYIQHYMSLGL